MDTKNVTCAHVAALSLPLQGFGEVACETESKLHWKPEVDCGNQKVPTEMEECPPVSSDQIQRGTTSVKTTRRSWRRLSSLGKTQHWSTHTEVQDFPRWGSSVSLRGPVDSFNTETPRKVTLNWRKAERSDFCDTFRTGRVVIALL